MNLKVIITLIATVVWFGVGWWYYTCQIKGFCGEGNANHSEYSSSNPEANISQVDEISISPYPLSFKWGSDIPEKGADFEAYIDKLLADTIGGKSLTITGQYFAEESNPQLGVQRAKQLRLMLGKYIDTNRIYVSQELLSADSTMEGQFFESALFAWKSSEESILEQLGNELIIYFPYKSIQRIEDPSIDGVFDKLVSEIQQKKLSLELTGHTDNVGSDAYNISLGQNRAQSIKTLFVSKGIDANSISVSSNGESQPIGNNTTESGRRKNRRVEITIK